MEDVDVTTLSPKGQVVIPDRIRKKRKLRPGTKFAVSSTKELVIFKRIEVPSASEMLEEVLKEGSAHAKKLGIHNEGDALKRMLR